MVIIFENANFDWSKNVHYRYRGKPLAPLPITALPRSIFKISPHYRGNYRGNAVITAVNRPVSLSSSHYNTANPFLTDPFGVLHLFWMHF